MHEVLVNRLGGLSMPRKSVVRFTDHPDMTLDVYRGRKTTTITVSQPVPRLQCYDCWKIEFYIIMSCCLIVLSYISR